MFCAFIHKYPRKKLFESFNHDLYGLKNQSKKIKSTKNKNLGVYMDHHILAILGMAGKDKNNNLTTSVYNKDSALDLPQLKNGEFHNSTHCLIESFGESATYTFIGTDKSIKYQNDIFDTLPHCKAIFEKYPPQNLQDSNEIEDIFNKVLEVMKNTERQYIVLDITHGFRHQPIIASFASTLAQINTEKSITLLFAKTQGKDSQGRDSFQYISLERYSQISLIALSLQTFVQTLSVPYISSLDKKEYHFIDTLTRFSNALHANAFAQIFGLLNETKNELNKVKNSIKFKGLENILDEVQKILVKFEMIQQSTKKHKQYYEISSLMNDKEYYLVAITYIREAILLYVLDSISEFVKKNVYDSYKKSNAVNDLLNGKSPDPYIFDDIEILKKKLNGQGFLGLKKMFEDIAKVRNDLVHINPKPKEIKQEIIIPLERTLNDFKNKCIINDCLKNISWNH